MNLDRGIVIFTFDWSLCLLAQLHFYYNKYTDRGMCLCTFKKYSLILPYELEIGWLKGSWELLRVTQAFNCWYGTPYLKSDNVIQLEWWERRQLRHAPGLDWN